VINKKILILTGALVLLALLTLVYDKWRKGSGDQRVGDALFSADKITEATEIQIAKGQDQLVISKADDGSWRLTSGDGFPAAADKVVRFLDALTKTKYQSKLAAVGGSLDEYGLGKPTTLTIIGADKQAKLLVLGLGDTRAGGGQYVSLGGGEAAKGNAEAYLVGQQLQADLDSEAWENKVLVDIKKEEVKKVEFFDSGGRKTAGLSREKAEDKFTLEGLAKKDKLLLDAIDGVELALQRLAYQKRVDIGNEELKSALQKPNHAKFELFDGRRFDVMTGSVGAKDKERHFIKITADKSPALDELMGKWGFQISDYDAKKFQKTYKDFIEVAKKS